MMSSQSVLCLVTIFQSPTRYRFSLRCTNTWPYRSPGLNLVCVRRCAGTVAMGDGYEIVQYNLLIFQSQAIQLFSPSAYVQNLAFNNITVNGTVPPFGD